ncbi:CAP isoform A, partial [Operophtera brumata]
RYIGSQIRQVVRPHLFNCTDRPEREVSHYNELTRVAIIKVEYPLALTEDDYVTIRYKSRRDFVCASLTYSTLSPPGQPPERVSSNRSQYAYFDPRSGYLSEPEGGLGRLGSSTWSDAYDSDVTTGPRRRTASVQEERRMNEPYTPSNKYSTLASARASHEMYKQPGRIENYIPGRSSVVDKEAKQWWDEVMDIFDGQNISSTTALKESGYESDSTLVFRRREETEGPLSPAERRAAYRDLQAGGEPPLRGFRSPAPPRQVGELERATSTSDLRHRRKDEEIIDFERWKKIRSIERAEEELNNLYKKLKVAQTENDVLFYPRDVKDFRWNYDTDRGLRIKEKSVEDLKDHFKQISHYDSLEFEQPVSKDTYKPLWRGTSVAETAFQINTKKSNRVPVDRSVIKPTAALQQDTTLSELRKKIGLGSRLWSSLSMEQVHALKNQLNAIYSKELESKSHKDFDKYTIEVKDTNSTEKPKLQVRCNSLSNYMPEKENLIKLSKSDSIASIPCPITSVKDLKNNVNKIQMTLSENEKRKISQTLSKELLDRINKYDNPSPLSLKQELEISQEKEDYAAEKSSVSISIKSPEEPNNYQHSDSERYLAQSNDKIEMHCQSSASETETASSDHSNKTVVYRGPSKEVQMKVKYFESVTTRPEQTKTVYHARDNSDENDKKNKLNMSSSDLTSTKLKENESQKSQIVQSQSCANFKELFGESEKNKFLSLPLKPELRSRSVSPHSEVNIVDRRTPDTLRSSDETIWRSRSPSPDPERYWRAYLNLARAGEVRRLARRFDSPTAAGAVLRRHRSDPEIARNVLARNWSAYEQLSSRRDRCKVSLPVARVPLRTTNRYMPHIDIISKLAALRRRTAPRSRSAEEASQCRSGEVDRIRRRFETMSILGQIYASAPDVSELQDIAPYLAGTWIAHRYPMRSDNNRSLKDPSTLVRGRTSPVRKEIKRTSTKDSVKLSSILKSDAFEKQEFDPSLHRPVHRYEPPRTPPRPPPASWPYRVAPHVTPSRHTVTFQG